MNIYHKFGQKEKYTRFTTTHVEIFHSIYSKKISERTKKHQRLNMLTPVKSSLKSGPREAVAQLGHHGLDNDPPMASVWETECWTSIQPRTYGT